MERTILLVAAMICATLVIVAVILARDDDSPEPARTPGTVYCPPNREC